MNLLARSHFKGDSFITTPRQHGAALPIVIIAIHQSVTEAMAQLVSTELTTATSVTSPPRSPEVSDPGASALNIGTVGAVVGMAMVIVVVFVGCCVGSIIHNRWKQARQLSNPGNGAAFNDSAAANPNRFAPPPPITGTVVTSNPLPSLEEASVSLRGATSETTSQVNRPSLIVAVDDGDAFGNGIQTSPLYLTEPFYMNAVDESAEGHTTAPSPHLVAPSSGGGLTGVVQLPSAVVRPAYVTPYGQGIYLPNPVPVASRVVPSWNSSLCLPQSTPPCRDNGAGATMLEPFDDGNQKDQMIAHCGRRRDSLDHNKENTSSFHSVVEMTTLLPVDENTSSFEGHAERGLLTAPTPVGRSPLLFVVPEGGRSQDLQSSSSSNSSLHGASLEAATASFPRPPNPLWATREPTGFNP